MPTVLQKNKKLSEMTKIPEPAEETTAETNIEFFAKKKTSFDSEKQIFPLFTNIPSLVKKDNKYLIKAEKDEESK